MNVYTIADKKADGIVDDLLKRYPAGPQGRFKKEDYTMSWEWSQAADVYRDTPSPPEDDFGYDRETLSRVWVNVEQRGGIRGYFYNRDNSLSSKAVSRRYNRFYDRVNNAHTRFLRSNSPGVWEVRCPNLDVARIHVIAQEENAAILLARTVSAGAGIVAAGNDFYASKTGPADLEQLKRCREQAIERISRTISDSSERIKQLKEKSTKLIDLSVSLRDFNVQMDNLEA